MKLIYSTYLVLALTSALAQQQTNDSASFKIGIGVGYYLPGDATANYYNGRDNNRLEFFLEQPQINNRIRESLGGYTFSLAEFARDMAYNDAAAFELQLAYEFGRDWIISARFYNVSLAASGIFTLRVDRPNQGGTPEPYLEQADISGKETRSHIDVGLGKKFFLEERTYLLTEAGVDLAFVEVQENQLRIAGVTYSLPVYTNILNQQATNSTTFGSGFYLTSGIGFSFPADIDFLVKMTYIRTKINVNDVLTANTNNFIPTVSFTKNF